MPRDAFVLRIQKELCHPEWTRNVFLVIRFLSWKKRLEGRCKARAHFNIAHQVLIYSYYYQK